ncbi:hypothetical protein Lalb_Chr01g0023491 [Lupinus albus]|uniref:Uncharacterized protein n=1 Tax=Lupinus albus TaxID=3870 RepID=A0A6A4RB75_LUPAL|nr:hypothetical protein Lalb_Chr01g0023491 [Lupinus albus]
MEDARREISNALQFHNNSSSSPTLRLCVIEKDHASMKGNNDNSYYSNNEIDVSLISNDASQYFYYLLEAMPLQGPTWSTTSPSIAPFEVSIGLEFGNKYQVSSNIWWMNFVEGLDDCMIGDELDHLFVDEVVTENS